MTERKKEPWGQTPWLRGKKSDKGTVPVASWQNKNALAKARAFSYKVQDQKKNST